MSLFVKLGLAWAVLKGGVNMVDVYVALIVKGRRTIDQVPENLKAAVQAELTALELDGYGKPVTPAA